MLFPPEVHCNPNNDQDHNNDRNKRKVCRSRGSCLSNARNCRSNPGACYPGRYLLGVAPATASFDPVIAKLENDSVFASK